MYDITVLIAIYRGARFLLAKLDNLLLQTHFTRSQFILLNCQNLEQEALLYQEFLQHPNVVEFNFTDYIRLYASWNYGLQRSHSKYVTNSNIDDLWHPEYLERCCGFLDAHPEIGVVSSQVLVTDRPNQVYPDWNHFTKIPLRLEPTPGMGPCPVWRRSLHDRYGWFPDYNVISDARMWETWQTGGVRFHHLPDDLVLYLTRPDSLERRANDSGNRLIDLDLV